MDMEIAVFLGRALFYLSLCDTIFELNVKCNLNFTQTMKVSSGVSSYIISGYSCHLLPGIESCLDKLQVIGGFHNYLDVFNSNALCQSLYFILFKL